VQQRNALNVIYLPSPRAVVHNYSTTVTPFHPARTLSFLGGPLSFNPPRRSCCSTTSARYVPLSLFPHHSPCHPRWIPRSERIPRRLCKWPVPRRTMRRIAIAEVVLRERVSLPRGGPVYRHDYGTDPRRYRSFAARYAN